MATESKKAKQVGRKPKADPCRHRLAINLNDADFSKFLALFEQSGLQDRAHFITACIFNRELKVDKAGYPFKSSLQKHIEKSAETIKSRGLKERSKKVITATIWQKKPLLNV
jgi:hypothetical protein